MKMLLSDFPGVHPAQQQRGSAAAIATSPGGHVPLAARQSAAWARNHDLLQEARALAEFSKDTARATRAATTKWQEHRARFLEHVVCSFRYLEDKVIKGAGNPSPGVISKAESRQTDYGSQPEDEAMKFGVRGEPPSTEQRAVHHQAKVASPPRGAPRPATRPSLSPQEVAFGPHQDWLTPSKAHLLGRTPAVSADFARISPPRAVTFPEQDWLSASQAQFLSGGHANLPSWGQSNIGAADAQVPPRPSIVGTLSSLAYPPTNLTLPDFGISRKFSDSSHSRGDSNNAESGGDGGRIAAASSRHRKRSRSSPPLPGGRHALQLVRDDSLEMHLSQHGQAEVPRDLMADVRLLLARLDLDSPALNGTGVSVGKVAAAGSTSTAVPMPVDSRHGIPVPLAAASEEYNRVNPKMLFDLTTMTSNELLAVGSEIGPGALEPVGSISRDVRASISFA